jgi:hypothetical protein
MRDYMKKQIGHDYGLVKIVAFNNHYEPKSGYISQDVTGLPYGLYK